jgi:hypothetical protein
MRYLRVNDGLLLRAARPRLMMEVFLSKSPKEMQERADASFKRKEIQAREATKAMIDYEAANVAEREKTARLKAQRLAKEAADRVTAAAEAGTAKIKAVAKKAAPKKAKGKG